MTPLTQENEMPCTNNPPTVTVRLTFAMYQAAKMEAKFRFAAGEDPIKGIVVRKLSDRVEIEAHPGHLLDLVQAYLDLLDRRVAEKASWAAIRRVSSAVLEWMAS